MYQTRSGTSLDFQTESIRFKSPGIAYLNQGQINVSVAQNSKKSLPLRPGAVFAVQPEDRLHYQNTETVKLNFWTLEEFELVVGQELDLAVAALISLSSQQRHLNQLLPSKATEFPSSIEIEAATEIPSFQISTESSELCLNTQQDLFKLAFYGASEVNQDILRRFGRSYHSGEVLCQEGVYERELFILIEGSVEVSSHHRVLGQLNKGDIVGEMAVLEGTKRSASVTALNDVQVLALNREHFQMIFQLHPSWTVQLLNGFIQRLADTWNLMIEL